jgi:gliding motility-associated-like protein
MDKRLPRRRALLVLITLLFSLCGFAQLPSFTLGVVPAAQTCLGNGSLAFTVSGTVPGASVDYAVYLLPNTTTPLTVVTTATVGGLVAGNYLVVATQSLAGESNTATQNITIGNAVVPLAYNIQATPARCGNDGVMVVNVTSGTAVSYEIMNGPVIIPQQGSNTFNNLQPGIYQVRVHDNCGEAVVLTYQLGQVSTGLSIGPATFPDTALPSCTTITVSNTVTISSAGLQVFYPVSYQITVFPPTGPSVVVSGTVASGPQSSFTVGAELPLYSGQYTYNIRITNACGNVYNRNSNLINRPLMLSVDQDVANCGNHTFTLNPLNYVAPYTVTFTAAPAGFNPVAFNASHPVFNSDEVLYGTTDTNPVPEGNYVVQIVDACGRTATRAFEVADPQLEPDIITQVTGCNPFGSVSIVVPTAEVVSVVIITAPSAYTETLPDDVSEHISNGEFFMDNLPLGSYTVVITDSCGNVFNESFGIVPEAAPLSITQNPGCETGYGSIRITAAADITHVEITAAPVSYNQTLPHNVSINIAPNGRFYMNSLPEGVYTFKVTDQCGAIISQQVIVEGYHIQTNNITLTPACGAFALNLLHISNGNNLQSFWLQKFNETEGVWEHPITGANYTANATPNTSTAYLLNNNSNNPNINATGHFRILKLAYIFSNGTVSNFRCLDEIYEFDFEGGPAITDAYSFPCAGGLTEVIIVAEGVPPLTYSITAKNNQPFVVNNGTSNLFSGLEPATYNFRVTDMCGNIRNIQFDINALDPIAIEAQGFCEGEAGMLSVEEFSFLNYEWWKAGSPGVILSTNGVLTFPAFNSAAEAGTYFVSITSDVVGSCVNQLLQYEVLPNVFPNAGDDFSASYCNDGLVYNLDDYLSAPHDDGGSWEDLDASGNLTGSQFASAGLTGGVYRFLYKVTGMCGLEDEAVISIELKDKPQAPVSAPPAAVCEGNAIQLSVVSVANAVYQWAGPGNFSSSEQNPVLPSAALSQAGNYSVTIMVNGCVSPPSNVEVVVNPLPQFTLSGNELLCAGQSTTLSVIPVNFTTASYTWYRDDIEIEGASGNILQTDIPANYKVEAGLNGCFAEAEINVMANTNVFTVELDAGCRDLDYIISVVNLSEIPGATFLWSGPDGYSHTGPEADITNRTPGEYSVIVTNGDGCGEDASITVYNTTCFIPKGISPNNDGLNDSLDLSNLDVKHIKIFNRYGLEVYEKDAYLNEWRGQSHRGDLPTGTYYYVITLSAGKRVTGWVYLQREI